MRPDAAAAGTGPDIEAVVNHLRQHGLRLVTAESCTAGLIASKVADVKGAGELLDCAFVTYSPEAKQRCLKVSDRTLRDFNLTSEEVAREMALGALQASGANLAVANTGVADSVDPDVPSGTQCYAWVFADEEGNRTVFTETRRFRGDRHEVREASAAHALARIPALYAQLPRR